MIVVFENVSILRLFPPGYNPVRFWNGCSRMDWSCESLSTHWSSLSLLPLTWIWHSHGLIPVPLSPCLRRFERSWPTFNRPLLGLVMSPSAPIFWQRFANATPLGYVFDESTHKIPGISLVDVKAVVHVVDDTHPVFHVNSSIATAANH